MTQVIAWFREQEKQQKEKLKAIGIASFGPIDLVIGSPSYGYITSTPKPGWLNTDLIGPIRQVFDSIPIGFDTDVNGGAFGEFFWGSAVGLSDFVYISMGTGVGAGGMARGQLLHGLVHPEMGHIRLPRVAGDEFPGVCPFHGDCWEGLCSGRAIRMRTGTPAEHLPSDHPVWRLEAQYIAYAIANIVCILSPQRVILGGSVRKAGQLGEDAFFHLIRENVQAVLNEYVVSPSMQGDGIHEYIVPPRLGDNAGICGAIALGQYAIA
jgi:fructokinase